MRTENYQTYTYIIPGLSAADPYRNYRFGVAIARARSDIGTDNHAIDPYNPEWSPETAFGEHGVVVGMNGGSKEVIDQALAMTKTPSGNDLVSTPDSHEPTLLIPKVLSRDLRVTQDNEKNIFVLFFAPFVALAQINQQCPQFTVNGTPEYQAQLGDQEICHINYAVIHRCKC